jgi:hypothetical protein
MFRKMFRNAILAGTVILPFSLPSLTASAAMPQTEGDYIPKHAIPIDKTGVVHHGPLDCVTARKIVREEGYRNVKARDCNGEIYSFRAERNGRMVHLRVDRESGRITRG